MVCSRCKTQSNEGCEKFRSELKPPAWMASITSKEIIDNRTTWGRHLYLYLSANCLDDPDVSVELETNLCDKDDSGARCARHNINVF